MTITAWFPFVFYVAAAVAYLFNFAKRDLRTGRIATASSFSPAT